MSKDKFQAYRKENKIQKIRKRKIKTDLNAVTGKNAVTGVENGKKFKHRNLKKQAYADTKKENCGGNMIILNSFVH